MDIRQSQATRFAHDALFYDGDDEYTENLVPYLRSGVHDEQAVLALVDTRKRDVLREALGADADSVQFADSQELGRNPARIIPVWQDFVDRAAREGRGARGVGEAAWLGRSAMELEECDLHEALLNVAFGEQAPWHLLCTYDVTALSPEVLQLVETTHPTLRDASGARPSELYESWDARRPLGELPAPTVPLLELEIGSASLRDTRAFVRGFAAKAGLDVSRTEDLTLVTDELVTNTMRHGDGTGSVRLWEARDHVIGEVTGGRPFTSPMIGRIRPRPDQGSGMGLWLVNHLCDLVQIRTVDGATRVRVHLRRS